MSAVLKLVPNEKTCTKCGEVKPAMDFHKCSRSPDGFKSFCKPCRNNLQYTKKGYESRRKLIEGGRICNVCNEGKNWDQFAKDVTGLNGKTATCVPCRNEKGRAYYKNNPDVRRIGGMKNREDKIKRVYGLTFTDVVRMYDSQHGRCANHACSKEISLEIGQGHNRAMIDHNHTTGKVRELLCCSCNFSLGYLEKQEKILLGLQDYLTKHNR